MPQQTRLGKILELLAGGVGAYQQTDYQNKMNRYKGAVDERDYAEDMRHRTVMEQIAQDNADRLNAPKVNTPNTIDEAGLSTLPPNYTLEDLIALRQKLAAAGRAPETPNQPSSIGGAGIAAYLRENPNASSADILGFNKQFGESGRVQNEVDGGLPDDRGDLIFKNTYQGLADQRLVDPNATQYDENYRPNPDYKRIAPLTPAAEDSLFSAANAAVQRADSSYRASKTPKSVKAMMTGFETSLTGQGKYRGTGDLRATERQPVRTGPSTSGPDEFTQQATREFEDFNQLTPDQKQALYSKWVANGNRF